jgi:hypothetical protein
MCHQASKLKLPKSFSASEIVAAVSIKQGQIQDKQYPPSTDNGTGIKDKIPPPSKMEDKNSYIKRLLALGISQQAASDAADQIYGQYDKAISGKTKKAIIAKLAKDYPSLSRETAEDIATNAIREAVTEVRGATNIRVASVQNVQVPAWCYDMYGDKLPDLLPSESHLKGAALDQHAAYMERIHGDISDLMRERALARYENRKQRAAALMKKEDAESQIPAWARITGAE